MRWPRPTRHSLSYAGLAAAHQTAIQSDERRAQADQRLQNSTARLAELAQAVGQPTPPTALQTALDAAQGFVKQCTEAATTSASQTPQQASAIGDVQSMLAALQAKLSELATPVPPTKLDSEGDTSMGGAPKPAAQAPVVQEPAAGDNPATQAAAPSGNAAQAVAPSGATATGTPAADVLQPAPPTPPADAPASSQAATAQAAAFIASQDNTELVERAKALCQPLQYDPTALAEARVALGARLAYPPLDFACIRRDMEKVQLAVAAQDEANDVQPQAKLQRHAEEAPSGDVETTTGGAQDDL